MKATNWILFLLGTGFLVSLPVFWFVASLASSLGSFHPAAGWLLWAAAVVAVACILVPILQFLRLPPMPPREMWREEEGGESSVSWRDAARLLVTTCDDPHAKVELQRYLKDQPNDLPEVVRAELRRRKTASSKLRTESLRQAAFLSFLSPHRGLDGLVLLWINVRQVYLLSRCYGFKPSLRGIGRLYAAVAGAAITLEALDEVAEQAVVEATNRVAGGIPLVGETARLLYDPLRAAAYVGFVGLIVEHLLRHELRKPSKEDRVEIRRIAWRSASEEVSQLANGILPAATRAANA